ncbi:K(+)-transporting ATPase subunit C [Bacteroides helcogenes]|uniref:Potassium-transporting ATPase KdpC subunit n=1 Tax=Bacteroides helcogenes (strain ATCC 35417 / DSM 20613 / JCM 6297 / CCUG 15421 / P 36-108) TaxID=693979 RepID=E6STB9_BACT6|nr:K(+)-transporting ATPase subunit C [Bacteroides helcogenes]ADV42250.1 Potassium-transporting ATPase [Bacteroides helcogenes P 36-108]MDY5237297.1 K(+)-transporting ATPase subunit C [Bacteroides helcogenes]
MKTLWKSIKVTLAFCVFFFVFYISFLWTFAFFVGTGKGNARVAVLDGKVVGAINVGQMFTKDVYFWGRPSAGGYAADASGGSNRAPTDDRYIAEIEARIDHFLLHHPYLSRKDVPAEMVTSGGSGLDPDITPTCAYIQVKRVARARGMKEADVRAVVEKAVERPLLGLFGTEKVNVLKLNIALEEAGR